MAFPMISTTTLPTPTNVITITLYNLCHPSSRRHTCYS